LILKKLEHYSMRFNEHLNSLKFALKRQNEVKTTVTTCLQMCPHFNPNELVFLEDVSELVIRARRCLAYTYAIRFYLKGTLRQQFFDMLQALLEGSLEKLNKRNEEPWEKKYIDVDELAKMQLGERFFAFKREVISLKESVEEHFGKTIQDIEANLPDVPYDGDKDHDLDSFAKDQWFCASCTASNQNNVQYCQSCGSPKPRIKL